MNNFEKEFKPSNWFNYYAKNTEKGFFFMRKENNIERFFTQLTGNLHYIEVVERTTKVMNTTYRTVDITLKTDIENTFIVISTGFETFNACILLEKLISLEYGANVNLSTWCIKDSEKRKFGFVVRNEQGEKVEFPKTEGKTLFDFQTEILKKLENLNA